MTLRSQIEYCFQQATQGGRFSQEFCVDRLVELVERERLAMLEKAADAVEHYLDAGGSVFSLSNVAEALRAMSEEPRDWRGIRWIDSIRASGLAEEIAKHFGHECDNCGEDVDTDSCEFAWVESKISEFLYSVGARVPAAAEPPAQPEERR